VARTPDRASPRFGAKIRVFRRRLGLSQVQLADRLGISASYLNLIEANKRPLPADLLIALARQFQVDLQSFTADEDARVVADLNEALADPVLGDLEVPAAEVRELAATAPAAARALLRLYQGYKAARGSADALAVQLDEGELLAGVERSRVSTEEVSDLLQRRSNHFPELEEGAEELWRRASLDRYGLYPGLVAFLGRELGVEVRIADADADPGVLRRYDADRRRLVLSELLPTRSRNFQLAHTIALLAYPDRVNAVVEDDGLTLPESRALARVAMANYFAGAVLMPYERFLLGAQQTRYDLDVLGRRFKVSFEQVAHRLTTLRRPHAEGVAFHYIRIDVAGNISKRFSASGIRIARFSGACPRWNVFAAFLTPGMIRVQLSRMPEGPAYFCIARTVHRDAGGYHAQHPVHAIGLGCRLEDATQLVYSDGIALDREENIVPVGVNCRLCARSDCEQRALPSLRQPLRVDEAVRRVSPYAPADLVHPVR